MSMNSNIVTCTSQDFSIIQWKLGLQIEKCIIVHIKKIWSALTCNTDFWNTF